ncbi:hypothetical protein ACHAXT_001150 [Thalassiosira profunda]
MATGRRWLLPALLASLLGLLGSSVLGPHRVLHLDPYLEAGAPPVSRHAPSTSRARGPPALNHTREDFWERDDSSCVHVDHICSGNGRWFYAPAGRDGVALHQPNAKLLVRRRDIADSHGHDVQIEKGIWFNVSSASHHFYNGATCSFSDAPYHMVVQSSWNEMMGEFYSRTMLGLDRWMQDYPIQAENVQMYVHFVDKRKQRLFEGHRLFLRGLPNNDKFDLLLSMMPGETCQCYAKLVFCGYYVETATTAIVSEDDDGDNDADDDNDSDSAITPTRQNVTIFKPKAVISNPKTECGKADPQCTVYRNLRRDLLDTYKQKGPQLEQKIRQYRVQLLEQKGYIRKGSASSVDEWKFVGLAHRKYRRRWLNIDEAIDLCDDKFANSKVACVTIDVEEAKSPAEQLLMHHSLNALVGVHGAQLTQGVLLPSHGYILELLPWIPFYLWGAWVSVTHAPTPLGVIFHETALNHIGYPLGRDSVPLCLDVDPSDEELERRCLMNETSGVIEKFRWADRDFNVPLKVIDDFIGSFLLAENKTICDNMKRRADEKGFVLYNAFCQRNATQRRYEAEHYYWEKNTSQPKNIHEGR